MQGFIGCAVGGGDTLADFEYVDEERQSTSFGGEFSISFDPVEFAMLYPSLIHFPATTDVSLTEPARILDIQPVGSDLGKLDNMQLVVDEMKKSLVLPDNTEIIDNLRKIPSINNNPNSP